MAPDGKTLVVQTAAPRRWWKRLKPAAREKRHLPTHAEEVLWERLRNRRLNGAKFRRQDVIESYIVDFFCPEAGLVVEVDGPIHEKTQDEDASRQRHLEGLAIRVIRFSNDAVLTDLDRVLDEIRHALAHSE